MSSYQYLQRDFRYARKNGRRTAKPGKSLFLALVVAGLVLGAGVTALLLSSESERPATTLETIAVPLPDSPVEAVDSNPEPARLKIDLPLPAIAPASVSKEADKTTRRSAPASTTTWKQITVSDGDTLSGLFKKAGLSQQQLHAVLQSKEAAQELKRIYPGQQLRLGLESDQLVELELDIDYATSLHTSWDGEAYETKRINKDIDAQQAVVTGTISNSLFLSAQDAGLSDKLIMEMVNIFGWDIDFALDIRSGDNFAVIYEDHYYQGEKVGEGRILGAEFTSRGKSYQAIWYVDQKQHGDYYDENGRSMRKAFLRTPVKFSRISSRFSLGRKHPILNKIRAHQGVDYAAPRGTPVKAAGDGRIASRGRNGGYGKVVEIHHGGKYSTLYAHLKSYARGSNKGRKVKQGQIIGYVGSTGLATGPHLHYEFRVNGVHRNPLTVKLPKANPIDKTLLADFKKSTAGMLRQLAAISPVFVTAESKY